MNEQGVEGGYDFKLVKEDKNLECPICLLLLREAMGTQCRHLLCKVCLEKLKRSSEDAGRPLVCPTCKEKIDLPKVYPIFYIDGVVTGSDVYCLQQNSGCQWVGTLATYLREHHETCDYVIVSCDNMGCGDKLARNLINKHAVKCPYRLVNCIYCLLKVKFNKLEDHHTTCQNIPVYCVMCCGVQVPRGKMANHLAEYCGLVEVECRFSNAGCNKMVPRMDLHKHNVEFTQVHMSFLLDKLNQSQTEIEQLKLANRQSQNEIEQLKIANKQSHNEIDQVEKTKSQLKPEIEELEEASEQFQNKNEQLSRTTSDIVHQTQTLTRRQKRLLKKRAKFNMAAAEQEHQLSPTTIPYQE